jgi:cell division protein FtsL
MTRFNLVLLLVVVASALYLVQISYESRRQFVRLESERSQTRQLEQDAEKLQLQLREKATHLRIDEEARTRLHMTVAGPAVTQYLGPSAAAPAAPAASGVRR